jgi:hypothetical protein
MQTTKIMAATNSRFAKARVSCFYDSEVLNSSFVHLMKFSAKNGHLPSCKMLWVMLRTVLLCYYETLGQKKKFNKFRKYTIWH